MSAHTQCRRCGEYFPMGLVDYISGLCRSCKAAPITSRVKAAISVVNHLQEQSRFEQTVKRLEGMVQKVEADRDQLKAENEALRKDAERYQWLREGGYLHRWTSIHPCDVDRESELTDRAIDMAREASHG